jgi:hypothetical protein
MAGDDREVSGELQPYRRNASLIVANAIRGKGEVRSLKTTKGNIRSFEDAVAPEIWTGYLATALELVDNGEDPKRIDDIARKEQVDRVTDMLWRQAQPEAK